MRPFAIAREAGVERINARLWIGKAALLSTQPVTRIIFETMEALKRNCSCRRQTFLSFLRNICLTMKKPPKGAALGNRDELYPALLVEKNPHLFTFPQSDYFNGKTLLEPD